MTIFIAGGKTAGDEGVYDVKCRQIAHAAAWNSPYLSEATELCQQVVPSRAEVQFQTAAWPSNINYFYQTATWIECRYRWLHAPATISYAAVSHNSPKLRSSTL